jgi:hypothetical protein
MPVDGNFILCALSLERHSPPPVKEVVGEALSLRDGPKDDERGVLAAFPTFGRYDAVVFIGAPTLEEARTYAERLGKVKGIASIDSLVGTCSQGPHDEHDHLVWKKPPKWGRERARST